MSYTWRSILSAREVIEKGAIKMVGTGNNVLIWEDPWVPSLPNFRIATQRREEGEDVVFVKDLWEDQKWNLPILNVLFSPREVDAICRIPVPIFDEEDSWSWHYSKNGKYSVKSAYNMLVEEEFRKKASPSAGQVAFHWKNIWHARVPPKVKLFAWRSVREGLPVMSILKAKGMQADDRCPMCGESEETIAHTLLFCPSVISIWHHSVLRLETKAIDANDFREWCIIMQGKIKEEIWWDNFWCLAWGIWLNRNAWVFDKFRKDEAITIQKALYLVREFDEANAPEGTMPQEQQIRERWKAPTDGLYKLNTDAAFQNTRLGIGGVLRDEEGDVMMVYCSTIYGNVDVDVGEALAMRCSLRSAMEAGFTKFALETDSIHLFHQLKTASVSPSYFGSVVKEILKLAKNCQRCVFSFVKRTGNKVAHILAKLSFSFSEYRVWLEEYPPEIQGALCNDIEHLVI